MMEIVARYGHRSKHTTNESIVSDLNYATRCSIVAHTLTHHAKQRVVMRMQRKTRFVTTFVLPRTPPPDARTPCGNPFFVNSNREKSIPFSLREGGLGGGDSLSR